MIRFQPSTSGGRIVAAFATILAFSTSTAALADCNGTGDFSTNAAGAFGLQPSSVLPFAAGGAVSSLISAINTANTAFLTQSTAFVSAPGNPAPNQEGGGVWGRAIGGEITTKNTTTTTNVNTAVVGPLAGSVTCNNRTNLQFAGVQLGADIARLNWAGWNVHVGTTAGYLGAKARDTSTIGPLNPQGGTLQDVLQVPFAGVYIAATRGGFFVDGQIRADYYQNSLNDPITSGLFSQKLDARGIAVTGNIGYNQALQNNWFIEPSAGIVASRVQVDPLNVSGTLVLPPAASPNLTVPGQLRINDIQSTLGRLSVRGGTTIAAGNMVWQPFAIASVYHEFERNTTSSFNGTGVAALGGPFAGLLPTSGNISTTNIGTYGQVGVGLAGQVANTGFLGYLRGDYRFGERVEGYSINGGLRYQFSPEVGNAPMYAKAPILKAPVLVAAYNWTGFYIGASGGALSGRTDWTFGGGATTNPRFAGALGGGQIGYDHQFGRWVVGVEASLNATNAHGARACPNSILFTCETSTDYFGTATARLGYAFTERSLWYVRGGGAFDSSTIRTNCNTGNFVANPLIVSPALAGCGESQRRDRAGYTLGVGSEFALTRNWTARTETNFYDMGRRDFVLPSSGAISVRENGFATTVGVNYRFGGPVVAKY